MHVLYKMQPTGSHVASQQRANNVKTGVRRNSLSHRNVGSALVTENGVRSALRLFDPAVWGDKHIMPNILLW
jgi:hypothetical protein